MATGRTTLRNWRVYIDGRDLSGYSRSFGPLACTFDEGVDDAVTLTVKQTLIGNATVGMGTLNGIFDNTATSGIHAVLSSAGVSRTVLIAGGIQAAPAIGDPAFCGQFNQTDYMIGGGDNPITATITFANTASGAANLYYAQPWGVLVHHLVAVTAANTATGIDQAAQTTKGGYMVYHVTAANGTATIKVQEASTNSDGSFADLLSSGSIDFTGGGKSGIVALAPSATVKRYIRWQIALGTASSVTFAAAFIRGNL
jgi:hypothetical protein